jgi:hypothetical protein
MHIPKWLIATAGLIFVVLIAAVAFFIGREISPPEAPLAVSALAQEPSSVREPAPAECAEYHRMAVTLLQESRTMITALRDGLKRNDTNTLTAMGASAQSMKSRADTLAAAEKALRARFGL